MRKRRPVFKVGDIVRVSNIAAPRMVVVRVLADEDLIEVNWFNEYKLEFTLFRSSLLHKIHEMKVPSEEG